MKQKIILLTMALTFVVGITKICADDTMPWRDLPDLSDYKDLKIDKINIGARQHDRGTDVVFTIFNKKSDYLHYWINKAVDKTKRFILVRYNIEMTNPSDNIDIDRFLHITKENNSFTAELVEYKYEKDVFSKLKYNINEKDPGFMDEVKIFFAEAEKICITKLKQYQEESTREADIIKELIEEVK